MFPDLTWNLDPTHKTRDSSDLSDFGQDAMADVNGICTIGVPGMLREVVMVAFPRYLSYLLEA